MPPAIVGENKKGNTNLEEAEGPLPGRKRNLSEPREAHPPGNFGEVATYEVRARKNSKGIVDQTKSQRNGETEEREVGPVKGKRLPRLSNEHEANV